MVFCQTCCEPFHPSCKSDIASPSKEAIHCGRCSLCYVCNVASATNQVQCIKCDKTFDTDCLSENAKALIKTQLPTWVTYTPIFLKIVKFVDVNND